MGARQEELTIHTADGLELRLSIATVGSRSYAFLIDWHFRLLLALAYLLAALMILGGGPGFTRIAERGGSIVFWAAVLPAMLIYALYHPLLEALMQGRTPGKRMAGVRIVDRDGHAPSLGAILLRNIFRLLDSLPAFYVIGLSVAAFHPRALRIGDIAAGTVLVHESTTSAQALARIAAGLEASLSPAQAELLHDLLLRWKSLDRDARIALATELLQQIGRPVPSETHPRALDKALRAELSSLVAA